ncbi:MAG: transglutaminaseTgpA domain-containing protein [Roseburia sp.]|nr:transglutaminaseTgpA domain-containing protein [Roseburia sp.]MCM1099286.1 transglutaminaseTgpA domain-containing protein [Ruminococcus flavefaciens]
MKNRAKFIFSIMLLLLHALGATGALAETLKLEWGRVLKPQFFFPGLLLLCALGVLFWLPCRWKRLFLRGGILFSVYAAALFICRRDFLNSLGWAMDAAVERINERYAIRMIWSWTLEENVARMPGHATLSVLAVLVPYVLLLSYGVMRQHLLATLLADGVWFAAACGMDSFPGYGWFLPCVVSIAGQMLLRTYRDNAGAGVCAAILGIGVLGGIMLPVYFFLLPRMDESYEQALEARVELSRRVNEEWIPRIQETFSSLGFGHSADVTGSLDRPRGTILTGREVYRVTLVQKPRSAVYLRGFVGVEYEGNEWKADPDSALTRYYKEQGWELPESGRELVNLTYNALVYSRGTARVEELAEAGSYSLYPYGAELGEEYQVHFDGTAERAGQVSEYAYRALDGGLKRQLTEEQAEEERRYRQYVYDRFCDYPAERLPELTAFMEWAEFGGDSVYDCLTQVFTFLRGQAIYELEAASTPRGDDFVEYFLFESQEGYCAHFASAAVLMLRYLGVPARYATGYSLSAGTFSRDETGAYTAVATDKQAHAWAEVYLDGIGWIPVEMTPGAAAFTTDPSLNQLKLAGELSEAGGQGNREPEAWRQESTQTPDQEEMPEAEETMSSESELAQEPVKSKQDKGQESDKERESDREQGTASRPVSGEPGAEEEDAAGNSREKIERPGRGMHFSPAGRAALLAILAACGLACLYLGAAAGLGRLRRRRFERADSRERVFLLHRNLRRLLRLSGHEERLDSADPETQTFQSILEKSGFGEKKPSEAEVHRAAVFCCGMAREEYEGLFFGKRPLFRWLDACSWESLKRMEIL